MLLFSILESINKVIGFLITALLARILADDFGAYLYYQTIFGYMYAFSLFSSDYNYLVNYKIDREYISSAVYYRTIFIKIILVICVLIFSVLFLVPHFTKFAFWPYLVSVIATLFVFDFILYVEDRKKELVVIRMVSQLATLIGVFIFYFGVVDNYYITIIQVIQTSILTAGIFLAARKYLPEHSSWKAFKDSVRSFRIWQMTELFTYFLLRNFVIFFTTIEMIILAQNNMVAERDIFAEGMRLSGMLTPFALFYINFNINRIKKGYYTVVTSIAAFLLLISPFYVLVFMGEKFIDKTYMFNYFIWVFVFNAFLEKDYVELLTSKNNQRKKLVIFNAIYFLVSVLLFFILVRETDSMIVIILFFAFKLLLYYLILISNFHLKLRYAGVITSCIVILVTNLILFYSSYYEFSYKYLLQLKRTFL
jgi:O-antigen/teichoic acid export membrane protein